jgi:hypothetical protein
MNAPIFFWQLNMFRRDFLTCYGRMQAMTLAALQCFERRSFFLILSGKTLAPN